MSAMFVRLSVFWQDHQLDVSLPAHRPVIDYLDDVVELFRGRVADSKFTADVEATAHLWVLSSPETGIINAERSLEDYEVLDGHKLYLSQRAEAAHAPFVDDIMAEMRSTIGASQFAWSGTTRTDGLLATMLATITLVGFVALKSVWGSSLAGLGFGHGSSAGGHVVEAWNSGRITSVVTATILTLLAIGIALWKPRPWAQKLAWALPIFGFIVSAAVLRPVDSAPGLAWTISITALCTAIAAWIALSRQATATAVAAGIVAVAAAVFGLATFLGASPFALAAWTAWLPIAMLLTTSTLAISSTGLAAMLRRSDAGESISRESIRAAALRTEAISRGISWAATIMGALIVLVLNSSSYWQQGLIAALLAIILILRTNGFSDARIISPLLIAGITGLAMSAGSFVHWLSGDQTQTGKDSTDEFGVNAWVFNGATDSWQPWAAAALVTVISMMVLAFIANRQPDELAEARMAKVITFIDVVASLAFIPIVLIGQGVLTYYWAVS